MSIEDKQAIQEMIARYSHSYDAQDAAAFSEVFAEDGRFEIFAPGEPTPVVRLESRSQIREWAENRFRDRRGKFTARHFQSGIVFDHLDGDEARLRVMLLVTR